MITVNSLSGGKTSSYMAIKYPADVNIFACVCIDYPKAAPKDKAVMDYCLQKLNGNFIASAEHEKSLKIMMQLEQILGKEIIWVRGKSFDDVIKENNRLPTWARRFCTEYMKVYPIFEYCYYRFGLVNLQIGFRADEYERIKNSSKNGIVKYPYLCNLYGEKRQKWQEHTYCIKSFPLKTTFHYQVINFWKEYPEFDFPNDSNCRGCHHKQPALLKRNFIETPDVMEWFSNQENSKSPHTFLDSLVSYEKIFQMNFTEEIPFDVTMCNSGGCTD